MNVPEKVECLRCKTTMEQGLISDRAYGADLQENWTPGVPQSTWAGLIVDRKQALPVITMRCPGCGALESYAPPA